VGAVSSEKAVAPASYWLAASAAAANEELWK